MKQNFGSILKQLRKSQHISQKTLAAGLCSQPMLSAIENGKYMPNSQLLINLCARLGIQADNLVLQNHFPISSLTNFNEKAQQLCDHHKYQELANLLDKPAVTDSLESSEQYQAYYYYLGSSQFHLDPTLKESESAFKLVLTEGQDTTLGRLAQAGLGLIYAKKGQPTTSQTYSESSLNNIEQLIYEENLNILFYLKGASEFANKQNLAAATTIDEGINFITAHRSTYMLANLYYLLAVISQKAEDQSTQSEANKRSQIFAELYQENIFKEI